MVLKKLIFTVILSWLVSIKTDKVISTTVEQVIGFDNRVTVGVMYVLKLPTSMKNSRTFYWSILSSDPATTGWPQFDWSSVSGDGSLGHGSLRSCKYTQEFLTVKSDDVLGGPVCTSLL